MALISDTTIDQGQVRELATGAFSDAKRNAIFIGATGTGKMHLCIGVASAITRSRARGRFFTLVDLVNQLEQEKTAGRSGRLAETLLRYDVIIIDELGYLPFSQSGGQLLFHLISKLYEKTSLLMRSRMLVPADAAEAQAAQDAAERLRRQLLNRVEIGRAAEWLEARAQLGREVFTRDRSDDAGSVRIGRTADVPALLRACLGVGSVSTRAGDGCVSEASHQAAWLVFMNETYFPCMTRPSPAA